MTVTGRWEAYKGKGLTLGEQEGVREVFLVTFNHSSHKDLQSKGPGNLAGIWGVNLVKLSGYQEK